MVGEVFRIAFEKRAGYDPDRPSARPWLYGIATNLLAKHRRREARRFHAMARLVAQRVPPPDDADRVSAAVDAAGAWQRVAEAVTALPPPERDALVLHVWEGAVLRRGRRRTGRPGRHGPLPAPPGPGPAPRTRRSPAGDRQGDTRAPRPGVAGRIGP